MNRYILTAGFLSFVPLYGQATNLNESLLGVQRDLQSMSQTLTRLSIPQVLDEGFGNRVINGKPFSATEERHSLQVLGDGTRIENTETNRLYRDAEGRTRVEQMNGTVSIYDPVAKFSVELDPATKTARKGNGMGAVSYVINDALRSFNLNVGQASRSNSATMKGVMSETTENLGSQSVNGVTAQGIRTTMTIPKGQIGNNKDIKVLTERWTSSDLQMLVKSINSDPRFGDTTYQLTKVSQSAPDPGIFQIPADYTVVDQTRPGVALKELKGLKALKQLPAIAAPPAAPVPPAPPIKQ